MFLLNVAVKEVEEPLRTAKNSFQQPPASTMQRNIEMSIYLQAADDIKFYEYPSGTEIFSK